MIKNIAFFGILFSLLVSFILSFHSLSMAYSALFSSFLLIANMVGLSFIWGYLVFYQSVKKALFIGLIKYPLLIFSIFWASKKSWMNSVGITIGICEFIIIIVLTVVFKNLRKQ